MDTTAKVDIRKLQLLNDRIAQTIDALNQVRLSVHGLGLSHTNSMGAIGYGQGVYGQGVVPGLFQGQVPGVPPQMFGAPGISHTSPYAQQAQAYGQPLGQVFGQQPPFGHQPSPFPMNPLLQQLLWQQGIGGLSHSDVWGQGVGAQGIGYPHQGLDPISAQRIMQMFPFAQMPVSPVV